MGVACRRGSIAIVARLCSSVLVAKDNQATSTVRMYRTKVSVTERTKQWDCSVKRTTNKTSNQKKMMGEVNLHSEHLGER
jgi:hypothetical protein